MDLSTKNKLDTVTVYDLMDNKFYIPDYQRGYRWTPFEVKKLLSDLQEFFDNEPSNNEFYCMQPLVVCKKDDNSWEVIDGQQRLTTLFLILSQIKESLKILYPDMSLFSLLYQSRQGSQSFLNNIDFSQIDSNIDYYHICNASTTIQEFFSEQDIDTVDFIQRVINYKNKQNAPSVKFIWYDVTEEINRHSISSEDKFSDLNIGKIGLTNSELIKSLFLNSVNSDKSEALRIATEWDHIEHSLQDDSFWSFIYGNDDKKYATRIEFLFDILQGKSLTETNDYYTFDKYSEKLKQLISNYLEQHSDHGLSEKERKEKAAKEVIKNLWKEISDKFYFFKGWYENNKLYHIIGYLRFKKMPINEIEKIYLDQETKNTDVFFVKLKKKALSFIKDYKIRDLSYEDSADHQKIRSVLLLFNILSIINCEKENVRFSFNDFYKENWDLEHVRSQTPKSLSGEERKDWIICNIEYFSGVKYDDNDNSDSYKAKIEKEIDKNHIKDVEYVSGYSISKICNELVKLLDSKTDISESSIYKVLYYDAFHQTEGFESYTHSIGNLVLLDQGTNRGYKNAFFPVKRQWIFRREHDGIYILPCTKNVFSKNYSRILYDLMNWNIEDAEDYINEIEEVLKDE